MNIACMGAMCIYVGKGSCKSAEGREREREREMSTTCWNEVEV